MALLGLICQIEPMELEKAYIIFGGLDMQPRANMAINLSHYNKLPVSYTKRIRAVRDQLQKGLTIRRNQVVHGAHRDMEGAETTLTMVRLKGEQRNKRLNASDISQLSQEIHDLGSKVYSIAEDLLARAGVEHVQINLGDDLGNG